MISHTYHIDCRTWKCIAIPIAMVVLFAALMQGVARFADLAPWPLLDQDRTILTHQVTLANRAPAARLVWIGDSSCLLDIDATLHPGVINLGTISHLGLDHHAKLLARYLQNAAEAPDLVAVFLHPDALRRGRDSSAAEQTFEWLLSGKSGQHRQGLFDRLGINTFRDYLLTRAIPIPLSGAYGREYGYTRDLYRAMEEHRGSLIAAGHYDPARDSGSNELWLSPKVQEEAKRFRSSLPAGIRLVVGLAPMPASFAGPDHAEQARALLREWASLMKADITLESAPLVLPDDFFTDRWHLDEAGRIVYTEAVWSELEHIVQHHRLP